MYTLSKIAGALAITLIPFYVAAQLPAAFNMPNAGLPPIHNPMLAHNNMGGAVNTTARTTSGTGSRLLYMTYKQYDAYAGAYDLIDSNIYDYPGNRGGYQNGPFEWVWQYDTSYSYHFDKNYPVIIWYPIRHVQVFDLNNNLAKYEYQVYDSANPANTTIWEELYTYDSRNNRTLTKKRTWDWHDNIWTSSMITNTYDGYDNLSMSITAYWNSTSLTWQNAYRFSYTYDWDHNLLTQLEENWNTATGAWDLSNAFICTYDSGNNILTQTHEGWNGSSWDNWGRTLFSNFVMHQPGIAVYTGWNGTSYDTFSRRVCTYNSYGQPLSNKTEQWLGNGWWPGDYDALIQYHYETYTTDIQNVKSVAADLTVYPVPAKDEITIAITWKEPQAFTITLTDMAGRIYTKQNVVSCTQYNDKISVADIPAGNYIITIESANGKTVRKITVAR